MIHFLYLYDKILVYMSRILIIDDDYGICHTIEDTLSNNGYKCLFAHTEQEAFARLREKIVDLILLDICLSSGNQEGFNILEYCSKHLPYLPIIIMSGHIAGNQDSIMQCSQHGAVDFIEKPFTSIRLLQSIAHHLEIAEHKRLCEKFMENTPIIPTNSDVMREFITKLHSAMYKKSYILLQSAAGAGKSTIAYYIHCMTASKRSRYYVLDLQQITNIKEVAKLLVGSANNGLLFQSVGGTLVFDNIDRASYEVQDYLYSIIEKLDSTKMRFKIISLMRSNRYSSGISHSLLSKISSLGLHIPSLINRQEDIEDLVRILSGLPNLRIHDTVLTVLKSHNWPDNIQELKAAVLYMTLSKPNTILPEHLQSLKLGGLENSEILCMPYRRAINMFSKQYFDSMITLSNGNYTLAAQRAKVDRSTLHRILKRNTDSDITTLYSSSTVDENK